MGVLEQPYVHADISFARGTTYRWGWYCYQLQSDGTRKPIDLNAQTTVLRLYTLDERLLIEKPLAEAGSDGRIVAQIDPEDFSSDQMRGRRRGVWHVIGAQPDGEALSARWNPADTGTSGSVLQTIPDLESGEVTLYGWGYWLAH